MSVKTYDMIFMLVWIDVSSVSTGNVQVKNDQCDAYVQNVESYEHALFHWASLFRK